MQSSGLFIAASLCNCPEYGGEQHQRTKEGEDEKSPANDLGRAPVRFTKSFHRIRRNHNVIIAVSRAEEPILAALYE
jgi:hypothetical protein